MAKTRARKKRTSKKATAKKATTPTAATPPKSEPDSPPATDAGGDSAPSLLGSSVQPSTFALADGRELQLGEVVREAFTRSGLTEDEWNELPEADAEARIAEVVAELDLEDGADDESDGADDASSSDRATAGKAKRAEAERRGGLAEAIRRNVKCGAAPMGHDFEGSVHRIRQLAKDCAVRCADDKSAAFLLGLVWDQVGEAFDEVGSRRDWGDLT